MKTKRLYYTNSNLLSFKAKITEVREENNNHITILDQTAFYPTSGGQQHDIGVLNNIEIINVIDGDEIQHVTISAVGIVGDIISGEIDYHYRHKNMKQHTAQHILSQSFHRLFNFTTMSVHLGENYGNVEFDVKEISDNQLQKAEYLSNQVISENRKVEPLFVHSDHIAKYNLRRPPKRTGEIRLVRIDDFECTACGGTHVQSTSEILLLKIISTEKIRGRVAVNFLCGRQAIDDYITRFQVTNAISNKLTCGTNEIEKHFDKLIETNKTYKQSIIAFQKELLPQIIDSLQSEIEIINNINLICTTENRFDKNLINRFALDLAEKCNGIAVLLYNDKIILSCVKSTGQHAGELAKMICTLTTLKGGGNQSIAQLGGVNTDDFPNYKKIIIGIIAQGTNEN